MSRFGFGKSRSKGQKSPDHQSNQSGGRVRDNLARQQSHEQPEKSIKGKPLSSVQKLIQQQRAQSTETKGVRELSHDVASPGIRAARELIPKDTATFELQKGDLNKIFVIKQPGYASGDQFGIAATLIHNPHAQVFLSQGGPRDHSEFIRDFYVKECGIDPQRITMIDVKGGDTPLKTVLTQEANAFRKTIVNELNQRKRPGELDVTISKKSHIGEVDYGTTYIAQNFSSEMRQQIRQAWKLEGADRRDQPIESWLKQRGIEITGKDKVAVVWTRFSGKKGEAHPEHDTSYRGLEQIISKIPRDYKIIICGDTYANPGHRGRIAKIAEHDSRVYNLTELWKREDCKSWGGNTRVGQLQLMDYLDRTSGHQLKHLGFRSGNLEAYALVGHQVRYMEEPGSFGGARMTKWHTEEKSLKKWGGTPIGYDRILIDRPPTRTGRYYLKQQQIKDSANYKKLERLIEKVPSETLRKIPQKILRSYGKADQHPKWVSGVYYNLDFKKRLFVLPGRLKLLLYKRGRNSGFTEDDLVKIGAYFNS